MNNLNSTNYHILSQTNKTIGLTINNKNLKPYQVQISEVTINIQSATGYKYINVTSMHHISTTDNNDHNDTILK